MEISRIKCLIISIICMTTSGPLSAKSNAEYQGACWGLLEIVNIYQLFWNNIQSDKLIASLIWLFPLGEEKLVHVKTTYHINKSVFPLFTHSRPVFVLPEKQSCLGHLWMTDTFLGSCQRHRRDQEKCFSLLSICTLLCHERGKKKGLFTQKPTDLADCHPNGNGQGWGRSIAIYPHS